MHTLKNGVSYNDMDNVYYGCASNFNNSLSYPETQSCKYPKLIFQFLQQRKLNGVVKSIVKMKSKDQLIADYQTFVTPQMKVMVESSMV